MGKIGYTPLFVDGKTLADILREVKFREKHEGRLVKDQFRKSYLRRRKYNQKEVKND